MFSANENIQLRQYKRQVVGYVEATIPAAILDLGVNVMAMQVQCKMPGCVPVETVIVVVFPASATELLPGLPESAGGSFKTKVLKPMNMVTAQDVLDALPPQFEGGQRSMAELCSAARDVMLAQITQLFGDDDVDGRRLMAQYLKNSLDEYMERNCEPPAWGEAFRTANGETTISDEADGSSADAASSAVPSDEVHATYASTGNIVMRRPTEETSDLEAFNQRIGEGTSTNDGNDTGRKNEVTHRTASAVVEEKSRQVSVNTVTRQRQQAAAERALKSASSNALLSRLSQREHAPGIRRPGCPCCDPDHPSNVVDQFMQL
jgi:hypothetical protein